MSGMKWRGLWKFEWYDKNDQLIFVEHKWNLITTEALIDVLSVYFDGGTQSANWYILLIGSNSTPALTWTYANIGTDFTEFTNYDELTRVAWTIAAPTGASVTNSASPAEFTASTGVSTTLYGAGLVNVNTKGDNASGTGVLWCGTLFATARPFAEAEKIKVVYTINNQNV